MSDRRGQSSSGESSTGNSEFTNNNANQGRTLAEGIVIGVPVLPGYLPPNDETFNRSPAINADEAGNVPDHGPVVGSLSPGDGLHVHHHSWTNNNHQRPQEIYNPGLIFGIRPNSMLVNSFAPEAALFNYDPNLRGGTYSTERRHFPDLPDLSNQTRPHQAARSYGSPMHIREPNSVLQQGPNVPVAHPFTDQAGRQHMAWSSLAVGIPSTYLAGRQQMVENFPLLPPFAHSGPESGVWNFGVPPSFQYGPHAWNFEASTSYANGPGSRDWNFEVAPFHNGLGPGPWSFEVSPSPYPALNEHMNLMDTVLQYGPRFLGPYSNTPRTFISQFCDFFGGLRVTPTPESFAADIERNHRALLEPHHSMYHDPQVVAMHAQDWQLNAFQPPFVMGIPAHEDMRFDIDSMSYEGYLVVHEDFQPLEVMGYPVMQGDFQPLVVMGYPVTHEDLQFHVDSMSYEELSPSGEQLENLSSGLTEETIMELLKKRNCECVTSDSHSDPKTCCICLDAYVHGEEIGVLNCGHEFHIKCIKKWLLIKNECPICQSQGIGS